MVNNSKVFRGIFESSAEGILVTNNAGEIVLVNRSAERIFGYEKGEMLGRSIESFMPENFRNSHTSHRDKFFQRPQKRKISEKLDLFALHKDGTVFPVDISLSYNKFENEIYAVAFVIDITEKKMSELALQKSQKQLQKYAFELENSNRELENFAYISSHDLQEPLRKIKTFGERIIVSEKNNLSEKGKDYLLRMVNSAERMQNLIDDLLTYSRLSTKCEGLKRVDLNDILNDVISDLEISIENQNARIQLGKLPIVHGDPTQMRQLFQNLISNSLKFISDDVLPEIKINEDKNFHEINPTQVLITVEDNGIGFKESYLSKMFSVFQRLHGNNYPGSGIGLSICKKISIRHGGNISATSTEGKGSVFKVFLSSYT